MEERIAVATVVGRTAPISSHLGDRAVIHADGRMEGFIGGACSRDIIRRQGLDALRSGRARLVRIRPDASRTIVERETVTVPMTCVSEGALDVYVDPQLPKRRLVVAGFTPVSDALARLGEFLEYAVVRFVGADELADAQLADTPVMPVDELPAYLETLDGQTRARSAGIAASQGHYDEPALRAMLEHDLGFAGLLASAKRAAAVLHLLSDEGVSEERLARVRAPAGLAIGARKPAEVAVSIFAEIVAAQQEAQPAEASPAPAETAIDPVCGMEVEPARAHLAQVEGKTYAFCCPHCRASFLADPQRYLTAAPPA